MPLITTSLDDAINDLLLNKPVAIPTETVYGLAAPIDREEAIKAVFAMKNRPLNHPLIVHVALGFDLSKLVAYVPDYAQRLISTFWPGPLTLVLPSKPGIINPLITGGQTTVAIRCPAHPVAQQLLSMLNTPLVAPSANPFGKISPTTAAHVAQSFADEALTILDGGRCSVGIESTIVDATNPDGFQVLRHGSIDEASLTRALSMKPLVAENNTRVPGKLDSHYQPNKTLYYFDQYETLKAFCKKREGDVFVIAGNKPITVADHHFRLLASLPEKAAYELYYQLREADASNAICIAIELPPAVDHWLGVRERVLKAGHPYKM